MEIYIGTVLSRVDELAVGKLSVRIDGLSDNSKDGKPVQYTTPYGGNNHAGFGAIPEKGTRVLVCKPVNDPNFYYFGSVVEPSYTQLVKDRGNMYPFGATSLLGYNPHEYKFSRIPQTYGMTSPMKNSILLKDSRNSEADDKGVVLKASGGQMIKLDDSSANDCIMIKNKSGEAHIKIQNNIAGGLQGPQGINIKCVGTLNLETKSSQINMKVIDGKDLTIENLSTEGQHVNDNDRKTANIYINTTRGDVMITSKNKHGGVYVDSEGSNSVVQVRSQGKAQIYAAKGINMYSANDINIKGKDVNIQSTGRINLNDPATDKNLDNKMAVKKHRYDMGHEDDKNEKEGGQNGWPFFHQAGMSVIESTIPNNEDSRL